MKLYGSYLTQYLLSHHNLFFLHAVSSYRDSTVIEIKYHEIPDA